MILLWWNLRQGTLSIRDTIQKTSVKAIRHCTCMYVEYSIHNSLEGQFRTCTISCTCIFHNLIHLAPSSARLIQTVKGLHNVTWYSRKYWQELNLAVESQIAITNISAGFKFSGSVQDCHMYYNIIRERNVGGLLIW